MKLPFSYRSHFFKTILIGSFFGHAVVLGIGTFVSGSPKYGVEQGSSSMEVVLYKEPVKKEKKAEIKNVFSIPQSSKTIKQNEIKEEKQIEKSVVIPAERGAINEAKPIYLKNPAPVYPELARVNGWEGTVILEALVSEEGTIEKIQILESSGYKILDESAYETIKTWKFSPAKMGQIALSSWVRIPVQFILKDEK